jgi:hypothetical protein
VYSGPRGPKTTAWAQPEIYVTLAAFADRSDDADAGASPARRGSRDEGTLAGYAEERPGRVVLEVEICAAEYRHSQAIRELVVAPLMVHLESIRELRVSRTGDGSATLAFRDLVPSLHKLTAGADREDDHAMFCSRIEFHIDGFLHVRVMRKGGFRKAAGRSAPRKPAKKAPPAMAGPAKRKAAGTAPKDHQGKRARVG